MNTDVARSRCGFTLIELLIVLVIVGLLSAIALPRLGTLKDRGYASVMTADLRNVATQQESYLYDHGVYAAGVAVLPVFRPSVDVTVVINEATAAGWSATATHARSLRECSLFVGNAAPVGGATEEGKTVCG